MSASPIRVSRKWLSLREPVDAAARASSPSSWVDESRVPAAGVIHDLGCGTGAMGRWLAPLLPGPQHWVLHDRDAAILEVAAADLPGSAADGATVPVETTQSDIIQLDPGDLADASLITASALLDLLTAEELATLLTVCAGAGCPILPSPWRRSGSPDGSGLRPSNKPALGSKVEVYARRCLAQATAGQLEVTVDHADLLAWPS